MRPLTKSLVAAAFAMAALGTATTAFADRDGRRGRWWRPNPPQATRPAPAIPEPTAALAFAVGLVAVSAATRRRAKR